MRKQIIKTDNQTKGKYPAVVYRLAFLNRLDIDAREFLWADIRDSDLPAIRAAARERRLNNEQQF